MLIKILAIMKYVQIMMFFVLPTRLGASGANYAKNLLRAAILVQYIPRLFRILPLLIGQSETGFIFESAWANFIINLLIFMLASHIVGSCWYLFGLQVTWKHLKLIRLFWKHNLAFLFQLVSLTSLLLLQTTTTASFNSEYKIQQASFMIFLFC